MYETLIERLRKMHDISLGLSALMPYSSGDVHAKLYKDAADAIEYLSARAKVTCDNCVHRDKQYNGAHRYCNYYKCWQLPIDYCSRGETEEK